MDPLEYEVVLVPGGTDLEVLADFLGVTRKALKDLNAELFLGYIPREVGKHYIRVPKGASRLVYDYVYRKIRRLALNECTKKIEAADRTKIWRCDSG